MSSVNFSDFYVYLNINLPSKFKMPDFYKYDGSSSHGSPPSIQSHFDQIFKRSEGYGSDIPNRLIRHAFTWYNQLDLSKIKNLNDLVTTFVSH